ncbi:MAG: FMN-binding protein [bacterium]|nr:FMN-binding protein [bacterium]
MGSVKRENFVTVAVLALALLLDVTWSRPDPERRLAQRLLGADGAHIELDSGPAFRVGARWLLFFDRPGKVGPIRGAILVEDESIRELHLFEAREGIDHSAFRGPALAHSLVDQPARAPVDCAVISGATISSQLLIDAVDSCLEEWRAAVR